MGDAGQRHRQPRTRGAINGATATKDEAARGKRSAKGQTVGVGVAARERALASCVKEQGKGK